MAYTIQILQGGFEKRDRVLAYLNERLTKENIFNAKLTPSMEKGLPSIIVKPVRLVKKKPYCGNHPGECQVNPFLGPQKKSNATYLEWNDWVAFHAVVNRVLNRFRCHANVWSNPQDVKGKMLIRLGLKSRKRYDWTEEWNGFQTVRIWNKGTSDQF